MRHKLNSLAKYDFTTALPNNYRLHQKFDYLISQDFIVNFALFYIDLDNFHWVINYLGHQIGGDILKEVVERLINICRENGFLSKGGNHTFTFIVYNFSGEESVNEIAEDIIHEITQLMDI